MSQTDSTDFTISTEGPAVAASTLTELEVQTLLLQALSQNADALQDIHEELKIVSKYLKKIYNPA